MKLITNPQTLAELNNWADKFVKRIQVELQNKSINASGNLSNSLTYEIVDEGDTTHIKVYAANYLIYAEGGRKAGKIPANFVSILEDWIADKGLSVPSQFKNARQFAGAIAYNIKTYGSRRKRNNDIADVVAPAMNELYPKLQQLLEARVVMYINDHLYDN